MTGGGWSTPSCFWKAFSKLEEFVHYLFLWCWDIWTIFSFDFVKILCNAAIHLRNSDWNYLQSWLHSVRKSSCFFKISRIFLATEFRIIHSHFWSNRPSFIALLISLNRFSKILSEKQNHTHDLCDS